MFYYRKRNSAKISGPGKNAACLHAFVDTFKRCEILPQIQASVKFQTLVICENVFKTSQLGKLLSVHF
jgi:hypothetical protein